MTALLLVAVCLAQEPLPPEPTPEPTPELVDSAEPRVVPPPEPTDEPTAAPAPAVEPVPVPVPVPAPAPAPEPVPVPEPVPAPVPEAPRDTGFEFVGPPAPVPPPDDRERRDDREDEQPIIIVPPQGPPQLPVFEDVRDVLLPALPMRGLRNGLVLLMLSLASGLIAAVARRTRAPLQRRGLLPAVLRVTETGARILVVFFGLGVLAAWLPASLAPGLPWVVVAGAIAVGWSARDVLPDLVAWLFMSMEGHVRAGQWLEVGGRRGRVETVGMRATWLRDSLGNELVVPNRMMVQAPVLGDEGWPTVEVRLRVEPGHGPAEVRSAIREAAQLSPWVAPCEPEVYRDGDEWVVRVDLLEGTYADRLEGTLTERLEEILRR